MAIGACGMFPWLAGRSIAESDDGTSEGNGEQIYFSAVSERTGRIGYSGGPLGGGMMTGWRGLACVSCHGAGGRCAVHLMHMLPMDAPDIRWSTLAVVDGQHPDGTDLSRNMPRWDLGDEDLADLADFLRSLP